MSFAVDQALIPLIIVDTDDGPARHLVGSHAGIIGIANSGLPQVPAHAFADRMAVDEIERQEPALILELGYALDFGVWAASLAKLAAFAVHENCIRTDREDRIRHGDARPGEVEHGRGECLLVTPLFVPGAVERAHPGTNVHLVDGCIEADPGIARREPSGIFSERLRHFAVLKIA